METINRTESVKPMSWGMSALISLMVFLVLAAVAFLSGCATPIQVSENKCAGQGGSWEYTDADGFKKFRCDLPVATSTAADRKLVGSIR